jgi:hypothetical protein
MGLPGIVWSMIKRIVISPTFPAVPTCMPFDDRDAVIYFSRLGYVVIRGAKLNGFFELVCGQVDLIGGET